METLDSEMKRLDSEMKRLDLKIQTAVKSAKIFDWVLGGHNRGSEIYAKQVKNTLCEWKVLQGTYMQGENKYNKIYSMLKK